MFSSPSRLLSLFMVVSLMASVDSSEPSVRSRVVATKQPLVRWQSRAHEISSEASSFMHAVAKPVMEVSLTTPVTGTITTVLVEEGVDVKAGQPLLKFDPRLTEARLAIAEAAYRRSLAAVKQSELDARLANSRHENLMHAHQQDAATDIEIEESLIRRDQASASYQASIEEVEEAEQNRTYARLENQLRVLEAPFAGRVTRVLAVPGQTPSPGDVLVQLVDMQRLRAELYLPLDQYRSVRARKEFTLQALAPVHEQLAARLILLDSTIDPATQTIRCVLELDNDELKLPVGVRVRLVEN